MDANLALLKERLTNDRRFIRPFDEMIIRKLHATLDEILCKITGRIIPLKKNSFSLNPFVASMEAFFIKIHRKRTLPTGL